MENKGRNDIMNIDLEAQVIEIGNIMLDIELVKKAYEQDEAIVIITKI